MSNSDESHASDLAGGTDLPSADTLAQQQVRRLPVSYRVFVWHPIEPANRRWVRLNGPSKLEFTIRKQASFFSQAEAFLLGVALYQNPQLVGYNVEYEEVDWQEFSS